MDKSPTALPYTYLIGVPKFGLSRDAFGRSVRLGGPAHPYIK